MNLLSEVVKFLIGNLIDGIIIKLTITPRIWVEQHLFNARSNMVLQVLNLFSYSKYVVVDKRERVVTIRKKRFWFFSKVLEIPFEKIRSIDYSIGSIWMLMMFERCIISLCLVDTDKKVKLFSFIGSAKVGNETDNFNPEASLWVNHNNASWKYLKLLENFTGKSWP